MSTYWVERNGELQETKVGGGGKVSSYASVIIKLCMKDSSRTSHKLVYRFRYLYDRFEIWP